MTIGQVIALIKALGGGGSSLPSVTSSDNGKVLAVKDGAWAADSNLFIVTITVDSQYINRADKTFAEITAAMESGKDVVCVKNNLFYFPVYKGNTTIMFASNNGAAANIIVIASNESVSNLAAKFLPSVSAADNGSELIVKSGAWAKQQKKFVVTLTPTSPDYSGTMDKTPAEITAAYGAGQEIVFDIPSMSAKINATQFLEVNEVIRAGSMVFYDVNSSPVIITVVTDSSASTYATQVFAMTPAS